MSLAIAAGLGLTLYVGFIGILGIIPSPPLFVVIFATLFFLLGYRQCQTATSRESYLEPTEGELFLSLAGGLFREVLLMHFWANFASFPFLFLREILQGWSRTSWRSVRIALEIMVDGDDIISEESVGKRMATEPVETQRAILLLREMRFLIFRAKERHFLRTLEWQEFLEKSTGRKTAL